MKDLQDRLKFLVDAGKTTVADAVRVTGLSRSNVDRFVKRETSPNPTTIRLIEEFVDKIEKQNGHKIGIDAAQYLRDKGIDPEPQPRETGRLKLTPQGARIVGRVQAGGLVEADSDEHLENQERIPFIDARYPDAVALQIVGDSMLPDFRPGEFIVCTKIEPDMMQVNDFVVVQCGLGDDGRATFKKVTGREGDYVVLKPLNGKHKPVRCKLEDVVRVLKVIGQYMPR